MEGVENLGFNDTRDDTYWLSRFRFNAAVTPSKKLGFLVQVQDARVGKKELVPTGLGAVPGAVRPAHGVCRHRRHHRADDHTRRPTGTGLR